MTVVTYYFIQIRKAGVSCFDTSAFLIVCSSVMSEELGGCKKGGVPNFDTPPDINRVVMTFYL